MRGEVFNDVFLHSGEMLGQNRIFTLFLSRKAVSEFEMRVLFQMSANDSASLIDSPKASQLGLNRALFYNEQEGYLDWVRSRVPRHDPPLYAGSLPWTLATRRLRP